MNAATMDVSMMDCRSPRSRCERRSAPRSAGRLRARAALAVLALAALGAGLYGERWVLRDSPLAAFEYVAATCAALAVEDEQPSGICGSREVVSERTSHE